MGRPKGSKNGKNIIKNSESSTPTIMELDVGVEDENPNSNSNSNEKKESEGLKEHQLRDINALNDNFTVDRGMKVIHAYVTDNGPFANEISSLLSHMSNFDVRKLYVPLSLYGIDCDEKYILPVLAEVTKRALSVSVPVSPSTNPEPKVEKEKIKVEKEIIDGALASFEGLVDDILSGKDITPVQIQSLYAAEGSKDLPKYVEKRLDDLEVEYEGFNEYYSNLPKRKYNKIVSFMKEVLETKKKVQSPRRQNAGKPRKLKPQQALKAVEKMKYYKEELKISDAITLKSLHPVKLQGAKFALLYDYEARKLLRLTAIPGTPFIVKGTTIHNIQMDMPTKTYRKAVRSPEKTFLQYTPERKAIDDWLENKINAKALPVPSGRTNDNMLILYVE